MEGRGRDSGSSRTRTGTSSTSPYAELAQSCAHFRRRFYRKGDGKHPLRLPCPGGSGIGDSPRDRACFTGTCAGDNAHRPLQRSRGGTLPLIEPLKNPLRLFHASIVARFAVTARLMPMAESGSRQNIARIMRFACHSAVRIATDVLVWKGDET